MQTIVLVYQVLAAVVFVVSLFSAYGWLKNPFIGGFFEQTMVLNELVTREPGQNGHLQEAGFDSVTSLCFGGGSPDLQCLRSARRPGDTAASGRRCRL